MTIVATRPAALPTLAARWSGLSLASRFGIAAAAVLLPATLAIGSFVASRIEETVVRNSAQSTALFMDSVIAPLSQEFALSQEFSPGARRALEELFTNTPMGERVVSFKFWDGDGRVVWAENEALVGRAFGMNDDLRRAWEGEVVASFNALGDPEDEAEQATGLPLLEIYTPIREVWSGRVIAVAEFYEVAPDLARDLGEARVEAWVAVAAMTLGLGGVLTVIVLGGSRTIEAQRGALDARLEELRQLSARNQELRLRVQAAAARAAAGADRTLRGIGADLHDGPAQHLAYAALRLDALRERLGNRPEAEDLARIGQAVQDAMAEIRGLSRGLQLPDLAGKPVPDIVRDAVEAHEARTGHPVVVTVACPPDPRADPALDVGARVCLLRFLQEGLANASRHAAGAGLEVELAWSGRELRLAVRDRGPGLPPRPREGAMGLAGLRDRVESLGGSFLARNRPGGGTEIAMTLETGVPP